MTDPVRPVPPAVAPGASQPSSSGSSAQGIDTRIMAMSGPLPVNHDVRREARRRLTVGLSGLVVTLLVVLLASLLTGQARQEAAIAKAQAEAAGVANPGSAPIAGAPVSIDGLAGTPPPPAVLPPAVPAPIAPQVAPSTTPGGTVPDLEPDAAITTTKSGN